jgi:hypothetical protein
MFMLSAVCDPDQEPATSVDNASPKGASLPSKVSNRATRTYDKALWIFNHATETHYAHEGKGAGDQIVLQGQKSCTANADCSGFISYLLLETAPEQYQSIAALQPTHRYPQAKTYAQFFQSLTTVNARNGWLGLKSYKDLRQGDLIAWEKPPAQDIASGKEILPAQEIPQALPAFPEKTGNSGHVMLAAGETSQPDVVNVDGRTVRFVSVPVLDCSSVDHFKPEELPPHTDQRHRDGLGMGIVRLIIDDNDNVIGYWEGTYSHESEKKLLRPSRTKMIGFARLE